MSAPLAGVVPIPQTSAFGKKIFIIIIIIIAGILIIMSLTTTATADTEDTEETTKPGDTTKPASTSKPAATGATDYAIFNSDKSLVFNYDNDKTKIDLPVTVSDKKADLKSNQTVLYDQTTKHLQLSNDKCITSRGQVEDSKISTWECSTHINQSWDINKLPNGKYQYKQTGSDFCIAGANGPKEKQLILKKCNKVDKDQQWTSPSPTKGPIDGVNLYKPPPTTAEIAQATVTNMAASGHTSELSGLIKMEKGCLDGGLATPYLNSSCDIKNNWLNWDLHNGVLEVNGKCVDTKGITWSMETCNTSSPSQNQFKIKDNNTLQFGTGECLDMGNSYSHWGCDKTNINQKFISGDAALKTTTTTTTTSSGSPIGGTCGLDTDCAGFKTGESGPSCDKNSKTCKILQWPRAIDEYCGTESDCKGWGIDDTNHNGCDHNKCVAKIKDWAGNYYVPSEADLTVTGKMELGWKCNADSDCKGWVNGQAYGPACDPGITDGGKPTCQNLHWPRWDSEYCAIDLDCAQSVCRNNKCKDKKAWEFKGDINTCNTCPGGSFKDGANCYSCGGGNRTGNSSGSGKECSNNCPAGFTKDLNGVCFHCDGHERTWSAVFNKDACKWDNNKFGAYIVKKDMTIGQDSSRDRDISEFFNVNDAYPWTNTCLNKGTNCATAYPGSFEDWTTGKCYKCPDGFSRNAEASNSGKECSAT